MTSFGSQPVHPSSRLPIRAHSSTATRFPSSSSSSMNNIGPGSPSLVRRPTTATSNSTATTTTTSTSQAGDIPLANRASILDHTHAVNNTVDLSAAPTSPSAAAAAVASRMYTSNDATSTMNGNDDDKFPSSSRFDTSSTTNDKNNNKIVGSSRLSVRRALGQRAESESIAALRRGANRQGSANKHRTLSSHFDDSQDNDDDVVNATAKRASVDGRAMSSASQSSRTPFATVKRIFRTRSKSQSNPKNNPNVSFVGAPRRETTQATSAVIEAVPAIPPSITSPALMSTQPSVRRQSKDNNRATSSLFSFGRARSPPTRAKSTSSRLSTANDGSVLTTKRQPAKSFTSSIASPPPATNYGAEGGRDDDGVAGTSPPPAKRERKISGLPVSSSDGHSLAFGFGRSRTDRTLTLQSLSGTSSPPYGVRRSSLSSNGHLSPRFATLEASVTPRTDDTPTPTTAYFPRGSTIGSGGERGGVDAVAKQTAPDTSVPKIWQLARPSRTSTIDESPIRINSQQGRRQESSTTSGSALSFRTAQSFADEDSTPHLPRLSMDNIAPRRSTGMLDAITSIPRSAASPLTDLIENLEQRMSSSSTGASTPTRDTVARRAIQTATNASTPLSVQFPTKSLQGHIRGDDEDEQDEDESTFSRISVSSSSRTPSPSNVRRNTFGNDLLRSASQQAEHEVETNGQYWDRTTDAVESGGANVSMHDIENSLAAVEAALQDHRRAGSMDPNLLLQHIAPRSAGAADVSHTSFAQQLDRETREIDEQEPLARVIIPPEQQFAIANAVKQVRRAISSSQLPQIPNEDDSDVSRSPLTEFAPALVSANVMSSGTSKSELLAIPAQQRKGSATSNDSTPIRAARIRQESMQDVEQAYARMVDLVSSAAGIDLTPSPLPAARSYVRRPTQSQPSTQPPRVSGAFESPSNVSQYVRERTQSAAPQPFLTPSAMHVWTSYSPRQDVPPLPPTTSTTSAAVPTTSVAGSSTRATRQQLLRESDALSRVIGPLPDLSEETLEQQSKNNEESLRGRTSNVSLGSRRAISSSPQARYYRDTIDVDQASTAALVARAGRSPSRADSGGMHTATGTSPSIAAKTQGSAYAAQPDNARHQPTAMASVFYPASHNRSASAQNVYEWQQNRSRYSSPASARLTQQANATAAKRVSNGSNDVPRSSSEIHRQIADELAQRRMRAAAHHLSGSSAGILNEARTSPEQIASVFGSAAGSTAQHATDSGGTGSYRRSGSVRDWGRIEDVTSSLTGVGRPSSNLSGGGSMMYKNTHGVRKSDGSDLSDPVRLAFLNQRMASPASSSMIAMQQRHALERDSLLDMLDRTRSEAHELGTRNEHLRADLHLEVTRVLELERECERRKQNEQQLARRVQALEQELKVEQADRVRIGELLERVQRAVDEAANARSSGGGGAGDVSVSDTAGAGLDSGDTPSADDRFDQHVGSRILDVDEETNDNVHVTGILDDAHRQRDTSSPTSSSISIRQEDLLPIKTRIFDVSGTVDDQELLHGLTTTTSAGGAGVQEHSIFDLYGHNSRDSTPLNRQEYVASSPSLDSHASQLGLTFEGGEQEWSLDEEVLPDVIQSEIVQQAQQQTPTTPQSRRASSQHSVLPPHTPLRHVTKRSPVVDSFGASLSGTTSSSSLTKKRRFPSLNLAGQSDRARTLSNGDPPTSPSESPRSARQASHSSRTTAADTSAFTSPAGSHVPAFAPAAAVSRKVTPNAIVVGPSRISSMQSKRASVDTKAYAAMMQSRIPQMISAATAAKPALQNEPITSSSVAMRNIDSAESYYERLNNAGAASLLRIRSNEQE